MIETTTGQQYVWTFQEAPDDRVDLLGGKGFGLVRMTRMGLPVPPGLIVSTQACWSYQENGRQFDDSLWKAIVMKLGELENQTNKELGNPRQPLLLSVRSGAPISMPGMMDTILNVGMTPEIAYTLAVESGDNAFGIDTALRFIKMFAATVLRADEDCLCDVEEAAERLKSDAPDLTAIRTLFEEADRVIQEETGKRIPDDPYEQLQLCVGAVFDSWFSPRAIAYRKANKIPDEMGTAVVIQSMVFGNLGANSGTGVAFTRNPITGDNHIYGEYLAGAQGEDVVSGIRTPESLDKLKEKMPETHRYFIELCRRLEAVFKDALDIEFTIEKGQLYLLQVRSAKRTPGAAVRIAVDLVRSGILKEQEGLRLVSPDQIEALTTVHFDLEEKRKAVGDGRLLCRGNPASPGHIVGKVVLHPDRAVELAKRGESVILVRTVTSPVDIHGMIASVGIVTAKGGATSHAAVVARALPRPCVTGCKEIVVEEDAQRLVIGDRIVHEGEMISVDGDTGEIYLGVIPLVRDLTLLGQEVHTILSWAERVSLLSVGAIIDAIEEIHSLDSYVGSEFIVCRLDRLLASDDHRDLLVRACSDPKTFLKDGGKRMVTRISELFARVLDKGREVNIVMSLIDPGAAHLKQLIAQDEGIELDTLALLTEPELIEVQLKGIAVALKETGNQGQVTVVLPRAQSVGEVKRYVELAQKILPNQETVRLGAVVQTPHGLRRIPQLVEYCNLLILDIPKIFHNYYGIPIEVLKSQEAETYHKDGIIERNPVITMLSGMLNPQAGLVGKTGESRIAILNDSKYYDEIVESALVSGVGMLASKIEQIWPVKLSAARAALLKSA